MTRPFAPTRVALLASAAFATLLAGCVPNVGPAPQPRAPASLASASSLPNEGAQWPGDGWWQAYGDPQLDQLVREGLTGSPDIASAAARIRKAEGMAEAAGAALGPSLDAGGQVGKLKQSYVNGFPKEFVPKGWNNTGTLNLQLAWDLDLFGRARATRRAALTEAEAARIDAEEARLALATAIASAYADLARYFIERDVSLEAEKIQRDSANLVSQRVTNGLDTQAELRQARALVPAARVDTAAIDESILLTRHQLAALIGAGPDRGLSIERPKMTLGNPAKLPADAGIALIGRRPDIVAARLRAEAERARIKAAKAAFYPNITLSGLIGLQSLGLSNLLTKDAVYGNTGPALSLPLFDSGERAGNYRGARADYDSAVATYDKTLIGALKEVADALASRNSLVIQQRDARAALDESEGAYRVARLRYEGGLSTYLSVLSAQQTVITARRRDADLAARAFTLDVALVRALGGGFTEPQGTATAARTDMTENKGS